MDLDQLRETTHCLTEIVWPAKAFGVEGGELVDVFGSARTEQWLQDGIGQHAAVIDIDE